MSLIQCFAVASLGAIAIPALHAGSHCPAGVSSLPLRVAQSSVLVASLQLNHSGPYDFVVDTGAQITTIEPSLALDLQLKIQGTTGVEGVATSSRNSFVYLDSLEGGHSSVSHSLAVIQEIPQLKAADARIRGILGENFLSHFDLLIDNRQHILCLDDTNALASAVRGRHTVLSLPYGSGSDFPFTQPIVVSAHLSAANMAPILLRIDSGSNVPVLYATDSSIHKPDTNRAPMLKRVVNGAEQAFAVLPPQDLLIGAESIRQVSFVMPMNSVGTGFAPRENGLLPTLIFHRVFISYEHRYAILDPW